MNKIKGIIFDMDGVLIDSEKEYLKLFQGFLKEQGKVYSLERVQFLADIAKINLAKYPDITNVQVLLKDGSLGLKEHAPYDGIHISVAFEKVPEIISNQLKVGGKLICPTVEDDIRIVERTGEIQFKETIVKGYFFDEVMQGIE